MSGLENLAGTNVTRIGISDLFGKVDSLLRTAGVEVGLRSVDECVSPGQFHQIGADLNLVHRIQLGGGPVVKPARVVLPDRPHAPGYFSVTLPHLEVLVR